MRLSASTWPASAAVPSAGTSGDANGAVGGEDAGVGSGGAANLAPLDGLLSVT